MAVVEGGTHLNKPLADEGLGEPNTVSATTSSNRVAEIATSDEFHRNVECANTYLAVFGCLDWLLCSGTTLLSLLLLGLFGSDLLDSDPGVDEAHDVLVAEVAHDASLGGGADVTGRELLDDDVVVGLGVSGDEDGTTCTLGSKLTNELETLLLRLHFLFLGFCCF